MTRLTTGQRRSGSQLRPSHRVGRLAAATLALVAIAISPATAQEVREPGETGQGLDGQGTVELLPQVLPVVDGGHLSAGMAIWAEGRRGYQKVGAARIASVDLDSFEEVARTTNPLDPSPMPDVSNSWHLIAVDQAGGRLFVPYQHPSVSAQVGGFHVLDGETLTPTRDPIPLLTIALDSAVPQPYLKAITYTPPTDVSDGSGKLHLLLADTAVEIVARDAQGRSNATYAVQVDIDTGETEWAIRVEACVGTQARIEPKRGVPSYAIFRAADPDRPYLYVGCYVGGSSGGWAVRLELDESNDDAPMSQEAFPGPVAVANMLSDPQAERILMWSGFETRDAWWVFDGNRSGFLGKVGVGVYGSRDSQVGRDPTTGRMYVLAPRKSGQDGGLLLIDGRSTPIDQGVPFPAFADVPAPINMTPIAVDPATPGRPARLFFRPGWSTDPEPKHFVVFEDSVAFGSEVAEQETVRTVDVPEVPGATASSFTGTARAFGYRTILVYGVDGVHNSPVDHDRELKNTVLPRADDVYELARGQAAAALANLGVGITPPHATTRSGCSDRNRELIFGLAGSQQLTEPGFLNDLGTATARAVPAWADTQTKDDLANPATRCSGVDSAAFLRQLGVRGFDEPGLGWDQQFPEASCIAPDQPSSQVGNEVFTGFSAETSCAAGSLAHGAARFRLERGADATTDAVRVGEASSSFDIERRPEGGLVVRASALTRGIEIVGANGTVHLDAVSAEVVSWANGRLQPEDVAVDPNCDLNRTAGTCYRRVIGGARVIPTSGDSFSCEQCETEESQARLVEAMQRALGSSWKVERRAPDAELAEGAKDGAAAGITKPEFRRQADSVAVSDLLPSVAALELVRVNDANRGLARQVYQFAGIEATTQYAIQCLLEVIDGACTSPPASLTVSLTDTDTVPLAGGVFEVTADDDALAAARVCTTGSSGTCTIAGVPSGTYQLRQKLAPPGYVRVEDVVTVVLPAGGIGDVQIVNGRIATTGIAVQLVDAADFTTPLAGGEFEVWADDGNGERGGTDVLVATCSTGSDGACVYSLDSTLVTGVPGVDVVPGLAGGGALLSVPAGPYIVHQSSTPEGYAAADDVAFTLPEGQVANLTVPNGRLSPAQDEAAPGAEEPSPTEQPESDPAATSGDQPAVMFEALPTPSVPAPTVLVQAPPPSPQAPPVVGSDQPASVVQIFQAPGEALRLLLRDPKDAAAFGGVGLLFASALAGAWRRRLVWWLLST